MSLTAIPLAGAGIGLMLGIFLYRDQESGPAPDPMSTT